MAEAEETRGTRFTCQHHARRLLSNLNATRKNPELCDAYVSIDDQKICVQKSVLSASSQYLRALFSYDGMLAQHNGKTCISLNVSVDTFHSILDYIYTCEIHLTEDNIQDLLQAADLLLLGDLKEVCCSFLEDCIAPHNCIGIRDFTARLSCPWLHLRVSHYLDEHVREATYSEEFLRMSVEDVCGLLSRDTLQVRSETDILEAIIRWCNMDMKKRGPHLPNMVTQCVRTSQMDLITESDAEFSSLALEEGLRARVMEILRNKQSADPPGVHEPRGYQQVIVVCGGEGRKAKTTDDDAEVKSLTRCVPLRKNRTQGSENVRWLNMAPMLTPRSGHGLVEVGGYLYAVGGRDRHCWILNTGEKYDPTTDTWSPIAPMEHARVGFGLVAVDDNIYAMGGSNDLTEPLVSMEVYNVFTDKWRPLPDMILKRVWSAFAAAADKKIYVIAGGIVGKFYETVECFDTRTETWASVSPMQERRIDARAVAVDGDIYVFGGFRRLECPSAVQSGHNQKFCGTEMYASANDYWVTLHNRHGVPGLCSMSERCSLYGALYDGEDILVVGTLEVGHRQFHSVRAFNRHATTWHTVVQSLPEAQTRYQCSLLKVPMAAMLRLQESSAGNPPRGGEESDMC
ncbi:hypothetical protein ACOMHN_059086 [Nucella lapillus]